MDSKKQLEVKLSKLEQQEGSDAFLEQYQTPSDIAASVLWTAYMNQDIKNRVVADLGCGNGILGIGALLLGAKKVFFVDIDKKAILTAKRNVGSSKNAILMHKEIRDFNETVDLVLQNPPFGVQNEHADKSFLVKAMQTSNKIYSFHKLESEAFIRSLAKEYSFILNSVIKFKFPLKPTKKFHTKKLHIVDVGCFILTKTSQNI